MGKRKSDPDRSLTVAVAAHRQYRMPEDPCYLPLHVGNVLTGDIRMQGDDSGDHISEKNPYYCELTGLYWMWKQVDSDYLGLVHYRRYFKGKQKKKGDPFRAIASGKELLECLKDCDIILPRKRYYVIESVYSHYAHTHYAEHLDQVRILLQKRQPDYLDAFDRVMKARSAHMFNMFIMSKEKCDAYCSWLFPILSELEAVISPENYDNYQGRLYGRISEILLNVWIEKNRYAYKVMPVLSMEKTNWIKKGSAFLRARFLGVKYNSSF